MSPRDRTSVTNGSQRSRLATGFLALVSQPRASQPCHWPGGAPPLWPRPSCAPLVAEVQLTTYVDVAHLPAAGRPGPAYRLEPLSLVGSGWPAPGGCPVGVVALSCWISIAADSWCPYWGPISPALRALLGCPWPTRQVRGCRWSHFVGSPTDRLGISPPHWARLASWFGRPSWRSESRQPAPGLGGWAALGEVEQPGRAPADVRPAAGCRGRLCRWISCAGRTLSSGPAAHSAGGGVSRSQGHARQGQSHSTAADPVGLLSPPQLASASTRTQLRPVTSGSNASGRVQSTKGTAIITRHVLVRITSCWVARVIAT